MTLHLVDTSAWVEWFRDTDSPAARVVAKLRGDPDEIAAFGRDGAFALPVFPRRLCDANDSTQFEHPVQFEAADLHSYHLVNVMKRRGADHDEADEERRTGERHRGLAQTLVEQNAQYPQSNNAQHAYGDDEQDLETTSFFVPALGPGDRFQRERKPGLQVELFIEAEQRQQDSQPEPQPGMA